MKRAFPSGAGWLAEGVYFQPWRAEKGGCCLSSSIATSTTTVVGPLFGASERISSMGCATGLGHTALLGRSCQGLSLVSRGAGRQDFLTRTPPLTSHGASIKVSVPASFFQRSQYGASTHHSASCRAPVQRGKDWMRSAWDRAPDELFIRLKLCHPTGVRVRHTGQRRFLHGL